MTELEFKVRTKQIALRVLKLVDSLPNSSIASHIGKQLFRAGTSIGANYRAACRGKSRADVIHKLPIVEEEADESLYWLEVLADTRLVKETKLAALSNDISEVLSMTVASIKTLRRNNSTNPKSKI